MKRLFRTDENEPKGCVENQSLVSMGFGATRVLDYSMPQKNAFTAYTSILFNVDKAKFIQPKSTSTPSKPLEHLAGLVNAYIKKAQAEGKAVTIASQSSSIGLIKKSNAGNPMDKSNRVNNEVSQYPTLVMPNDTPAVCDIPYRPEQEGKNYAVLFSENFGNYRQNLEVVEVAPTFTPNLYVVEEYVTESFIGNYGAGNVVETMTLAPGEKRTISIKTFKELTKTQSRAENVLDSFSESSAKELEDLLQKEQNTEDTASTNSSEEKQASQSKSSKASLSLGGVLKAINISANASKEKKTENSTKNTVSASTARTSSVNNLSKATAKSVNNSNSSRTVNVNTNTQDSYKESTEESLVRELVNPNISRALTVLFLQMNQEYITITYLKSLKIVYYDASNPDSYRSVNIEQLDVLLEDVIQEKYRAEVKEQLVCQYNSIADYKGVKRDFLQLHTETNCGKKVSYYRIKPDLEQTYDTVRYPEKEYANLQESTPTNTLKFTVDGIILNVDRHILKTAHIISDVILGQSPATDCFNTKVQEEKMRELQLANHQKEIALDIINTIEDPKERAEIYAKLFNPAPIIQKD
jgi:hypothetical protein